MQLHFKKTGNGQPVIILHGLFGSGDNWASFARNLSEYGYAVYLVDLRNHGHSFHADQHNYRSLAADVNQLMVSQQLENVILIGHSMGGKAAMQLAIDFNHIEKLIVIDIAPYYYPVHHGKILQALLAVDFNKVTSRKDVEQQLSLYIDDKSTLQFLLKNLYWKENDQLGWRFNLPVLNKEIEEVGQPMVSEIPLSIPTLFIRGELSGYIRQDDLSIIQQVFSNVQLTTIPGSGHWIHADQPEKLLEIILQFITKEENR